MNSTLLLGTRVVVFALIAYSIAIVTEQKKRQITDAVLSFLTLGIALDVAATLLMILGSSNSPFTLHGLIGYSALAAMAIDGMLVWRFRLSRPRNWATPLPLHLYSRYAYLWWVIAFITGGLLAIFK